MQMCVIYYIISASTMPMYILYIYILYVYIDYVLSRILQNILYYIHVIYVHRNFQDFGPGF